MIDLIDLAHCEVPGGWAGYLFVETQNRGPWVLYLRPTITEHIGFPLSSLAHSQRSIPRLTSYSRSRVVRKEMAIK